MLCLVDTRHEAHYVMYCNAHQALVSREGLWPGQAASPGEAVHCRVWHSSFPGHNRAKLPAPEPSRWRSRHVSREIIRLYFLWIISWMPRIVIRECDLRAGDCGHVFVPRGAGWRVSCCQHEKLIHWSNVWQWTSLWECLKQQ